MFLGHFAVGFAAKRAAPKTSLGWLMAAPLLADLLWPIFLLAGWERVRIDPGNTAFTPLAFDAYPWSHSLVMMAAWGAAFGGVYLVVSRSGTRGGRQSVTMPGSQRLGVAALLAALVVSHWVLDVVAHRPDMPLIPGGGPLVGLGLWNSVPATLVVEGTLFAVGVGLYRSTTRPLDRTGLYAFEGFVIFLAILYASLLFAPPPPGVEAIAYSDLVAWLLPLWAWWFDGHRSVG